jgi:hypothetical protein
MIVLSLLEHVYFFVSFFFDNPFFVTVVLIILFNVWSLIINIVQLKMMYYVDSHLTDL